MLATHGHLGGAVIIGRVVQFLRLVLKQQGIQGRVTCHVAKGTIQDVADVLNLVPGACATGDVLLAFT